MESKNPSKSLFEEIVDHALDTLRASGEFSPELIHEIEILAREEILSKPASLINVIKGAAEDVE